MNKTIFFLILITSICNILLAQTNWELLNPKPTSIIGKNIEFVSKDIGYIITSSELLETLDFGTTWLKKQNITSGNDICFKGGVGYIVGDNGYVLKSVDNGTNWQQISTGFNASFNDINIIDNNTVILSASNSIVKTIDGGVTWSSLTIPNIYVIKTAFTSGLIGHAVCKYGEILKTVDGGLNWYRTYSTNTVPSDFFTVYFINQMVGFTTREHSDMLKTTDGGETWVQIPGTSEAVYDFYFLDENNGFATGNHGGTYKTNNGGNTWTPIFFQTGLIYNTSMYGIFFQDNNIGFATGARGRIIKTLDGGITWTQYSPTYNDIRQLQMVNNSVGYALTGNLFYKTTNLGDTWTLVGSLNLGIYGSSSDFTFVNENLGYATTGGSNGGHVYKTTDGGVSWSILNNGNDIIDEGIASIYFLNDSTGFISGGFNQKKVMKTTNGGNSWKQVSDQVFGNIQFINSLVGYANRIGNYFGAMYKTIDGGNTWNLIVELVGKDINYFHFVDENNGFFVGDNALFYKTTDGGLTWQKLTVPYGHYTLTKFYSNNVGFIISDYGIIYKTNDGGRNWEIITVQFAINSIELTDKYIFTAGTSGKIYRGYKCSNSLSFSSPDNDFIYTTNVARANSSISATNNIIYSNILYSAGDKIELNPGFNAQKGSAFKAQIGGCN